MRQKLSIIFSAMFIVSLATLLLIPTTGHSFWFGDDMAQYLSPDGTPTFFFEEGKAMGLHQMLTEPISEGNCVRPFPPSPCGIPGSPACDCSIVEELGQAMHSVNIIPEAEWDGVTKYEQKKTWDGYTLLGLVRGYTKGEQQIGAYLIDMNGNVIREWELIGIPAKMFPGGYVMGGSGGLSTAPGASNNYARFDWCGNEMDMWGNQRTVSEIIDDPLFSGVHHDFQIEGSVVGYYYPGGSPEPLSGRTLVLGNYYPDTADTTDISDIPLMDDAFYEIDGNGVVQFEWHHYEHFIQNEGDLGMGYDAAAKVAIDAFKSGTPTMQGTDWQHSNAVSYLGPNQWYNDNDLRFHPDNIIYDSRTSNYIAIIARHDHPDGEWEAGDIVWRVGPHYTPAYKENKLGQIIGPHMGHMIPKSLPGGGNILVFDNGGVAGYGSLLPGLPGYYPNTYRDYSRVLEFNPVTLEVVWEYLNPVDRFDGSELVERKFYSRFISGAQRLPNGNTLITDGGYGRVFEVTSEGETVWEFINPKVGNPFAGPPIPSIASNAVYRAYRVPYDWAPKKMVCP